jgi:hypothetical protein
MIVAGLSLPQALVDLIHAGKWPCTDAQANRVHAEPRLIPEARVRALAPEESQIYLCATPLRTVAERAAGPERAYWGESFIPAGIDFGKAVVIGDFGLGSDAPILLDFSQEPPSVIRLRWRDKRLYDRVGHRDPRLRHLRGGPRPLERRVVSRRVAAQLDDGAVARIDRGAARPPSSNRSSTPIRWARRRVS